MHPSCLGAFVVNVSMSLRAHPKVGVALVNWNSGEYTLPCIASLLRSTVPPWRILVVDNASSDGSPDRIAETYPDVVLKRNEENVGFAVANNQAIDTLLELGADYVWVLNNDTEVNEAGLEALLAALEEFGPCAAATGKIVSFEDPSQLQSAGGRWRKWVFRVDHRGAWTTDRGQFEQAEEVDYLSGCCMLLSRAAVQAAGLFNAQFHSYWEDTEWCLRARQRGVRLRYTPGAVIRHHGSASTRKNTLTSSGGTVTPRQYYLTFRNRLYLVRGYAGRPWPYIAAMGDVIRRVLIVAARTLAARRWDKFRGLWAGVRDGLRADMKLVYEESGPSGPTDGALNR